jgi:hypothetical protein
MLPFVEPRYIGLTKQQKTIIFLAANFSESFLRFIPRKIKNYPSHGIDHTLNIIELTNNFLDRWGISLTRDEKFLLYLAAWLHDIGCIRVRKNHNRKSIELLVENSSLCVLLNNMNQELLPNLCDVIRCHSKSNSQSNCIEKVPKKRGKIRTQYICSIFRLMDACEITKSKCPVEVYKEIESTFRKNGSPDADAMEFWQGHMNITGVVFEKPKIVVYHKNFRKSQRIISELKSEILSIKDIFRENGTVLPKIIKKLHK